MKILLYLFDIEWSCDVSYYNKIKESDFTVVANLEGGEAMQRNQLKVKVNKYPWFAEQVRPETPNVEFIMRQLCWSLLVLFFAYGVLFML